MIDNLDFYIEKYGSDKKKSGYSTLYNELFNKLRPTLNNLLEIGIGTLQPEIPSSFIGNLNHYDYYKPGASLRAWRDFFPNSKIYGIDVADDCK